MARKGNMFEKEIDSVYLQENILVKVYEPEEYDPTYEINVCFMQDGDDYFQLGRVATISDELHEEYDIVNTYFVGIQYTDRYDRLKKYHPEGEQNEAYIQFLMKEVIPFIDEYLPINPLGTKRTLMGDSLAGTFALMTALAHPDTFQQVIMQSPYVNAAVLKAVEETTLTHIMIYHSLGLQEENVATTVLGKVNFIKPNQQLAHILAQNFSNYTYEEIAEGNHTWKYWQQEIPDIIRHMFA